LPKLLSGLEAEQHATSPGPFQRRYLAHEPASKNHHEHNHSPFLLWPAHRGLQFSRRSFIRGVSPHEIIPKARRRGKGESRTSQSVQQLKEKNAPEQEILYSFSRKGFRALGAFA
jgi:hypothetical protein